MLLDFSETIPVFFRWLPAHCLGARKRLLAFAETRSGDNPVLAPQRIFFRREDSGRAWRSPGKLPGRSDDS